MRFDEAVREFWIHPESVNKNISNMIPLYTAVTVTPQNPGWVKVIPASLLDEANKRNSEALAVLDEVWTWITNWDPHFAYDKEWSETEAKIRAILKGTP